MSLAENSCDEVHDNDKINKIPHIKKLLLVQLPFQENQIEG